MQPSFLSRGPIEIIRFFVWRFASPKSFISSKSEAYRSGHNETVLKTVWMKAHRGGESLRLRQTEDKGASCALARFGSGVCYVKCLIEVVYL